MKTNSKFQQGETVYILSNNSTVLRAIVLKYGGGFYTVRFANGGGTRLKEHRLFKTEQAAKDSIIKHK